jgi:hypothetical protein
LENPAETYFRDDIVANWKKKTKGESIARSGILLQRGERERERETPKNQKVTSL